MKKGVWKLEVITVLILVVFASQRIWACWADIPLSQVVDNNPVVVVGKIESINEAKPQSAGGKPVRLMDTALITVRKVLKNTLKGVEVNVGDKLPLPMPSKKNKMAISTDIYYKKGTDGVWILNYQKKVFTASYPKQYQPLKKEGEVEKFVTFRKQNPDQCQKCKKVGVPVIYGKPAPKLMKRAEKKEVFLGGCIVRSKKKHCYGCNSSW